METTKVKKSSSLKIIVIVSLVLLVVVGILVLLNGKLSHGKVQLTLNGEIAIKQGGQETGRITPDLLQGMTAQTFTATQKSSGKDPFDRSFTGVPLVDALAAAKVSAANAQQIMLGSLDGYNVALDPKEALDPDNVWLVWEADGKPLDDKSGPYMVIIRKDPFSQRWSKMLCEITIV